MTPAQEEGASLRSALGGVDAAERPKAPIRPSEVDRGEGAKWVELTSELRQPVPGEWYVPGRRGTDSAVKFVGPHNNGPGRICAPVYVPTAGAQAEAVAGAPNPETSNV